MGMQYNSHADITERLERCDQSREEYEAWLREVDEQNTAAFTHHPPLFEDDGYESDVFPEYMWEGDNDDYF